MNNYLKLGSWNAICDSCGHRFKADQLIKRWDGLMVDAACWEPRHPQDFLRAVKDNGSIPWSRPDEDGPNQGPDYVTLYIANGYFEEFPPIPPGSYFEQT